MKIFVALAALWSVASAQPLNDECISATVVSTFPFTESVNTRLATNNPLDPLISDDCSNAVSSNLTDGKTVWYSVQPQTNGLLAIKAPGLRDTEAFYGTFDLFVVGGVFTGACGSLTEIACEQFFGDDTLYLIVEGGETYTIKLGEVDEAPAGGDMNVTITLEPNFLEVFDADADTSLGPLRDLYPGPFYITPNTIDYGNPLITSSQLNVDAKFNSNPSIRSVRLTLDKPPVSRCETTAPYALFGNLGNNYYGEPFQIGKRVITATAYNRSSCSGPAVAAISQSIDVLGCPYVHYAVYDAGRDKYITTLNNATRIARPPCQVSIGVSFECGFTPSNVRMELRNAVTNAIVRSNIEYNAPYFLFRDNGKGDINSGTIPAGEYTITTIIDGIVHPSIRFSFGTCTNSAPGVDSRFNIDLRLGYSNLSSYNNALLFPPVVNRVSSLVIGDRTDVLNTTDLRDFFCGPYPPVVDDLYVCAASYEYNDGPGGVLGFLLSDLARESDGLPFSGVILYDEGDLGSLVTSGQLSSFFLQQMIQTLGVGLYWNKTGLGLADDEPSCSYYGARANAEFAAITGCPSVPLEENNNDNIATRYFNCKFWDRQCLLNEVLTLTVGPKKVSRITLGSLEDLGYVVNYTAADPYGISDIGVCSTCGSRRDAAQPTSSCHSGTVHKRAVYHGRKILKQAHEHYKSQTLPKGVIYTGNRQVSVAYMHEDGTLCSTVVTP